MCEWAIIGKPYFRSRYVVVVVYDDHEGLGNEADSRKQIAILPHASTPGVNSAGVLALLPSEG